MTMRAALFAIPLAALVACSSETTSRKGFAESTSVPSQPSDADDQALDEGSTSTEQGEPESATGGDADDDAPTSDCKTAAPSHACGVVPQCGCAKTETCDVVDTKGTAKCVAFGKAAMGKPCTATAGCAQGLTCVFGTCHAFCDAPGSACADPGTGACVQVSAAGGAAIPNLAVCRVRCAPEDPASCGGKTNAGTGVCYVDDQGGTDCQIGGTKTDGQTCASADECGPGLVCITPSTGPSVCKRWCRVSPSGGANDCGGTAQCRGFSTAVMVGTVEYGACP